MKSKFIYPTLLLFLLTACKQEAANLSPLANYQGDETYSVIFGGTTVGHLKTHTVGDTVQVDYDYKNNGRGPTIKETLVLNTAGFPVQWQIIGNTTFGNSIDEHYSLKGTTAWWTDATGTDSTAVSNAMWYVN